MAQQAGYLSPEVLEVYTFNTTPVTNWSTLRLDHKVANNHPIIFRLYHTGEVLDTLRKFTTAVTSSRFGRYDTGVQMEPKSNISGYAVMIFTCEFANRLLSNGNIEAAHNYPVSYAEVNIFQDAHFCLKK